MHSPTFVPLNWDRALVLVLGALAASGAAACRSTPAASPAAVSADTWAVVDGKAIARTDVGRAFRRVGDGAQTPSEEEALTTKLGILDDLIVQEILIEKARGLKIEVPESEIDAAYAEARKGIADDAFQQELTRRNLTAADMREGIRRDRLSQKLIEQEVASKVAVTDQEITAAFNANRPQFNLPEDAYHLAQIIVTPVREAQRANRTGDDAATPQAATTKVAMLMERLKAGATFGDLALDFSEDPESAARGGDLGLVPLSQLKQAPSAFQDAVLKVAPGTARVVNQGGLYTIVFVVAHEQAGQRELSTPGVREQITGTLRGRKEQLLRTAYLAAARADAEVVNYLAKSVVESHGAPPAAVAPAK